VAVTVTAAVLPVKYLDNKVGPMQYGTMTLDELTNSLTRDWNIMVTPDEQGRNKIINGFSAERLTQRKVLEKLARETNMELRIGYCGTGESLLYGAFPAFTTLRTVRR
jgi:hypothetical protein